MKLFNTISGNIIESGTRFKRKLPHGELVKKTMSKRATGVFKLKYFLDSQLWDLKFGSVLQNIKYGEVEGFEVEFPEKWIFKTNDGELVKKTM